MKPKPKPPATRAPLRSFIVRTGATLGALIAPLHLLNTYPLFDSSEIVDTVWRSRNPPSTSASFASSVPRVIWQTVPSHDAPYGAVQAAKTWPALNPTWDRVVLDDSDVDAFVSRFYNGTDAARFHSLRLGVMKADLFRYMVVYQHGGVYADADTECNLPVEDWPGGGADCDLILAPETDDHFCQWGFAARPRHPLFGRVVRTVLNKIVVGVDYRREHVVHETTGPAIFTDVIRDYFRIPAGQKATDFVSSRRAKEMRSEGVCWLTIEQRDASFKNLYGSRMISFRGKGWEGWIRQRDRLKFCETSPSLCRKNRSWGGRGHA